MACRGKYTVEQTDMDRSFVDKTITVSASSRGQEDVGGIARKLVALPGEAVATIGEQVPTGHVVTFLYNLRPVLRVSCTPCVALLGQSPPEPALT